MQRTALRPGSVARFFVLFAACVAGAASCSGRGDGDASTFTPSDGDGGYGGAFPAVDDSSDDDAQTRAATATARPVRAQPDDTAPSEASDASDASDLDVDTTDATSDDSAAAGACASPLAPGDLAIDELMIESVAGTGDDGEWLEVSSGLDCAANLNGLHGECPRGSKVATFDVTGDVWLPPRGTFVIADSSDPAINHRLPGLVVVWAGHSGDVLRNQGSTITLTVSDAIIDTVTYPSLALAVGTSVAFPLGCDAGPRSDFALWKRSTASWFPGFLGTPNAPNTDVECP